MQIKQDAGIVIPIDVSEWNDEIEAFINVKGLETFLFNARFLTFLQSSTPPEEKFEAAFEGACLALKDRDGKPLLTLDDREVMRSANFKPFIRMFNAWADEVVANGAPLDTAKKN